MSNDAHQPAEIQLRAQSTRLRRVWLWAEMLTLYALVPPIVAGLVQPHLGDRVLRSIGITRITFETGLPSGLFVFPLLLLTFLGMLIALLRDPHFHNRQLWNTKGFANELRTILLRFAIFAPVLLGITWFLVEYTELLPPNGFLRIPREYPFLMLMIAFFYPWISAFPQELTHRAFFFHRYEPIIGSARIAFVLNVLAFIWLHAAMWNAAAFVMTAPAGVLFARTYLRSRSTLAAGFEHAIYGVWVFFVGLGYFVFTGNATGV